MSALPDILSHLKISCLLLCFNQWVEHISQKNPRVNQRGKERGRERETHEDNERVSEGERKTEADN